MLPVLIMLPTVLPWWPAMVPAIIGVPPLGEAALFTAVISLWLWAVRGKIILLKVEGRLIDAR